jgi:transcriptional regulator with XRE-family HTH domain
MDKSTRFREETGLRLRRLREHLGLRQEDLGQIIGMVGTGISNIEKGIRGFDPEDAGRLKKATGVTLDWIYTGDAGSLPGNLFKPLTAQTATSAPTSRSLRKTTPR